MSFSALTSGFRTVLLLALLLLGACAPVPTSGPSAALSEQLQQLLQQQQLQAEQIAAIQQRLSMPSSAAEVPTENRLDPVLSAPEVTSPETGAAVEILPEAQQEIAALTASAAIYLGAFSDLAAGRNMAAEAGFTRFLGQFPNHQYAPNARYWLAVAQFELGRAQEAADNLRQVIADPRGQGKTPAALLKLAQVSQQQGLDLQAEQIIEQLRTRYPESPETQHLNRSEVPR